MKNDASTMNRFTDCAAEKDIGSLYCIQPRLLNIFTGIEIDTGEDEDTIECDVDANGQTKEDIMQDCCVERVHGKVDEDESTASLKVDLRGWD
jgi:hypothetical protein